MAAQEHRRPCTAGQHGLLGANGAVFGDHAGDTPARHIKRTRRAVFNDVDTFIMGQFGDGWHRFPRFGLAIRGGVDAPDPCFGAAFKMVIQIGGGQAFGF